MITKFIFPFLVLFSGVVFGASSVNLNLDNVKLPEFLNIVFGDVLAVNYVIDSDLLSRRDSITVHLGINKPSEVEKTRLFNLVESLGVSVKNEKGVYLLSPMQRKPELEDQQYFYYRPKYRSVDYLAGLLQGAFKNGRFTYRRSIQNTLDSEQKNKSDSLSNSSGGSFTSSGIAPAVQAANSSVHGVEAVDNGTNAFSSIDKNKADAFIFVGTKREVDSLKALLAQVDNDPGELFIRAQVYEVTTSGSQSSGVGVVLNLLGGKLGVRLAGQGTVTNAATFKTANIDAVFSALSDDSRFKTLSAPALRVRSGYPAKISVGSDVPTLSGTSNYSTGSTSSSITYRPSGVILSLTPEIRGEGVELSVDQTVSSFTSTTSGVTNSPTLLKREVQTQVSAKDGEVIVLGGMDKTDETAEESGVSFLPRFLHTVSGSKSRTEILLVMQVTKI